MQRAAGETVRCPVCRAGVAESVSWCVRGGVTGCVLICGVDQGVSELMVV